MMERALQISRGSNSGYSKGFEACTVRAASRNIQTSASGSSSNSLTIKRSRRAVLTQWIRFSGSPGAYSRTPAAFEVICGVRRRSASPPGSCPGGFGKFFTSTMWGSTRIESGLGLKGWMEIDQIGLPRSRSVGPREKTPRSTRRVREI